MINLNNVVFDSAMLYYGDIDLTTNIDTIMTTLAGKELGLSDGGVSFSSTPDIRKIPFAGSNERKIKGFERILKVEGKVEGEIVVINKDILEMSLYKADTTTSTKYEKYIPQTGLIPTASYKNLLVVGTTADEESILILIKNTYNGELSLDTKDKDEGKIKVSFEASYDSADSKIAPIEIYIPKTV